ncbi:MAG: hypothetical protein JSV36_00290 [Anaerolineae bacterium]|nr:MAG: hypothetical protein JSV36_00290 [Anaerolineae bacterium]
MSTLTITKEEILKTLDELPHESLAEVWQFLMYLKFKTVTVSPESAVSLKGLLKGYRFSEKDIAEARREMWGGYCGDSSPIGHAFVDSRYKNCII